MESHIDGDRDREIILTRAVGEMDQGAETGWGQTSRKVSFPRPSLVMPLFSEDLGMLLIECN